MVRLPSMRRTDRRDSPGPGTRSSGTATVERGDDGSRDRPPAHTRKIEQAAEKAAEATRSAAARAAAEISRARPRTSVLASLSLVLAVAAVLAVATGALAGLGAAVGAVAVLLGLAGLSATRRRYRHLAGRTQALVGLLLGLGAVLVGWSAMAGGLPWLDTGTDQVARLRDWLPGWLT